MIMIFQTTLLLVLLSQGCEALHLSASRDVAVIGGGVGGLVTSALLSKSGLNVLLLEKNGKCGGRMNSEHAIDPITQDSYRFDVGPSLLLLPDVYKETFELLGCKIEDHVELLRVDPFYRCYFEEDGTFAEISSDEEKMKNIANSIEPDGHLNFVRYLKTASDFLRFGLPAVIQERPEFEHFGSFLMACIKVFPLLSHDSMLQKYFKSSKMRAMMSFQDLYIGLSPYESPAIFSLLQALELERGIYYPKGGFASVATALQSIAVMAGVDIVTGCTIEGVKLSDTGERTLKSVKYSKMIEPYKQTAELKTVESLEDIVSKSVKGFSTTTTTTSSTSSYASSSSSFSSSSFSPSTSSSLPFSSTSTSSSSTPTASSAAFGVMEQTHLTESTNSHSISATTFITNIDAPEFEEMLVPVPERDERTIEGVPSCGIVSLNFAFNTTLKCLSHHTLFLSKTYKNSWNVVDNPDIAAFNPEEFNFYVHCPSRTDNTACPVGHDAVTVLVPVPPLCKTGSNTDRRQALDIDIVRTAVLNRLQIMENKISDTPVCILNHIVMERIREPEGWRRDFGLFRGSAFGLAHSIDQLSLLRPRLRHPKIKNLFR